MTSPSECIHIDLDGAWPVNATSPESYVDCRTWGSRLRYSVPERVLDEFAEFISQKAAKFTLFGSGDYHYLTSLWLRRIAQPFTLISFDNHPDSDTRPPRWCCGTWVNRALELPMLRRVVIWGCGNFELNWPHNIFVSRSALRSERLRVWAWEERLKPAPIKKWMVMVRRNWRETFTEFVESIRGEMIYVTIDLDCLVAEEAATNWENGLFKAEDIVWALREIRAHAEILGGDFCGGYSIPRYARWRQRIEATLDHPRQAVATSAEEAAVRNERAFRLLWTELTSGDEHDAGADEQHPQPEAQRDLLTEEKGRSEEQSHTADSFQGIEQT
jgi:hypothetical protein